MVETTLDIRFSAGDEACVIVASNATGETEEQAELVCFGQYAARIIGLLERERAVPLIHSLTILEEASTEHLVSFVESDGPGPDDLGDARIRVAEPDPSFQGEQALTVLARFLDARRAPRIFFSVKPRGLPPLARTYHAPASVRVVLYSLLKRRADDAEYLHRLARTAGLIGRLGATGQITSGSEFDVALAAADVAWRSGQPGDANRDEAVELRCPVCGNHGSSGASSEAFEFRLWPSERDAIRKCARCGSGLWVRAGRRPRAISQHVWRTMEAMRDELFDGADAASERGDIPAGGHGEEPALLEELKGIFVENRWPFSEVRGAPVLVSELSGPLGTWTFYAQVVEEQELILLYSVCPLRVPEERRLEVSHFVTHANYGLAAGNFELDFADGEIRYKTALHVDGSLSGDAVKKLVRANGIAMETYLPGIRAVIAGTPALPALERLTIG